MAKHLYAETLLTPGLGIPFQWRYGGSESDLLSLMDRESPVYGALEQSINRFDYTTFDLALNKPTLIEWANSQSNCKMLPTSESFAWGLHMSFSSPSSYCKACR